jgi:16S rRNA (guanine1207-N2)-methyltransferase
MGDHYFTAEPQSASRRATAVWQWQGREYEFMTDSGVFCRGHVDFGSNLMVESLPPLHGRVLDLGCGYGFVGVAVKLRFPQTDVTMCDINQRAVALAKENAARLGAQISAVQSDGFSAVEGSFDFILCNPPVRAGKVVYYPWFEQAVGRLNAGGRLIIVLQKKQGAPSARRRLEELFPKVEELDHDGGYHILAAEKEPR